MTVDRKRLRELALALQRAHEALHGMDKHMKVDAYSGGKVRPHVVRAINAIADFDDALEAAEQRALPMDDARDAARYRWLRGRNCAGSNRLPHITQYPYCPEIDAVKYPQVWEGSKYLPENLDAAIDAAIAEQRAAKESK